MTQGHIRVTCERHASGIRVHLIDMRINIQIVYELLENDRRNIKLYDLELSDLIFKIVCGKIIALGG